MGQDTDLNTAQIGLIKTIAKHILGVLILNIKS